MTGLEAILKRDRAVVLAALGAVVVLSWAYVLAGAGSGMPAWNMTSLEMAIGQSPPMQGGGVIAGSMSAMATPTGWTLGYAAVIVVMWWVMMVAMMLPSAAPMILLFAAANRRQRDQGGASLLPTGAFAWGYIVAWGGFSVIATALQWSLESAGVLSPMTMNSTSLLLAGGILLFAGLYQLTPIKKACLRHCRGPLHFLTGHWRAGRWGAFRMGLEHGAFCLGCCWGLMTLLFFGGIMNLYWITGLALVVLLEKTIPSGEAVGKITGGLLTLWSATFFYRALF